MSSGINEPFLGISYGPVKAVPQSLNRQGNPITCQGGPQVFTVPGTYQSNIAPRFQAKPYGSFISYNAPPEQYLAVPKNPLGYAQEVAPHQLRENYHNNSINNRLSATLDAATPSLPAPTMAAPLPNTIIADRFFSVGTLRKRQQQGADYIRGDLAIIPQATPCATQTWGIPAAAYNPQLALVSGALEAMGGPGDQSTSISNFLLQASQGTMNTNAGGVQKIPSNTAVGGSLLAMGKQSKFKAGNYGANSVIAATQF